MTATRVLILGATGGGSLLTALSKGGFSHEVTISALVRKPEQVEKLAGIGVKGIVFESLDDFDTIQDTAKEHDSGRRSSSICTSYGAAKACIKGLALRRRETGHETHYIHTSGASMVGDWPETGGRIDLITHSDLDDIYELEKNFPDELSPVRTVDVLVMELGESEAVRTYIVTPPLIFGRGTGLFTEGIGQVHQMVQLALEKGRAVKIGSGVGEWNRVHVKDLSNLYRLLVVSIIAAQDVPYGKLGCFFAENGSQNWRSIAEAIGKAGNEQGIFETSDVGQVELQHVADVLFNGSKTNAEAVLASNSRIRADRARQSLGWTPGYSSEDFSREIEEVVEAMTKQQDR